jgi:hypothetical protein
MKGVNNLKNRFGNSVLPNMFIREKINGCKIAAVFNINIFTFQTGK